MKKFFGHLFGDVSKAAGIVSQVSQNPLVSMALGFIPGGGTVTAAIRAALSTAGSISNSIIKAEATITTPGSGADKAALVKSEFESGLEIWKSIENAQGKDVVYDGAILQQIIDAQVLVFNLTPKLLASVQVVDLPKAV